MGSRGNAPAGVLGAVPWKLWGTFVPFLIALGELSWTLLTSYFHIGICIFMIKKTQTINWLCVKTYKHGKICEVYAWIQNRLILLNKSFCVDFVLPCCNKPWLGWKLEDKVLLLYTFFFAGMLPVIFGILSPTSHFCQARQKQKLAVKMTGMTGPSWGPGREWETEEIKEKMNQERRERDGAESNREVFWVRDKINSSHPLWCATQLPISNIIWMT